MQQRASRLLHFFMLFNILSFHGLLFLFEFRLESNRLQYSVSDGNEIKQILKKNKNKSEGQSHFSFFVYSLLNYLVFFYNSAYFLSTQNDSQFCFTPNEKKERRNLRHFCSFQPFYIKKSGEKGKRNRKKNGKETTEKKTKCSKCYFLVFFHIFTLSNECVGDFIFA